MRKHRQSSAAGRWAEDRQFAAQATCGVILYDAAPGDVRVARAVHEKSLVRIKERGSSARAKSAT